MTQTVRFVDTVSYTEADQSDFNLRMMRPQGVIPESSLGLLAVSAIGSMNVRVGPGEAFIQGFQYKNDANVDLAIGANSSGSIRIDTVILSLNRSGNTLTLAVKAGTPGAGVGPTLTQVAGGNWEFPIANITVASGAASIVTGNIADARVYSRWPTTALDTAMATDSEVSAAVAAESTARGTAITAAVNAEATTRASADTTLQNNINAEATTRGSADTTLQNNINAEATTRSTTDGTLQSNINAEATARTNADNTEAATRAAADSGLNTRVVALEVLPLRVAIICNGAGTPINYIGVASVSRTSAGEYVINLSTSMPHTAPVIVASTQNPYTVASYTVANVNQITVSLRHPTGGAVDATWSMLVHY